MARSIKTTFAGGEWADSLDGRVDIAKSQTAASKIENFICTRYGGADNRPGTTFVDYTTTGNIKLVPFEFSVDQTYMLEFSDSAVRFIKDGGVIQKSYRNSSYAWANYSGSIYCLTTAAGGDPTIAPKLEDFNVYENGTRMTNVATQPTQAGEFSVALNPGGGTYYTIWIWLSDGTDPDSKAVDYITADYVVSSPYTSQYMQELDWCQDGDTLFMAHTDVAPRKLQRYAEDDWRFSTMALTPSNTAPSDIDAVLTGFTASDRDVLYAISAITSDQEESLPSADVSVSLDLNWPTAGRVDLYWNSIRTAAFRWIASGSGTNEYYMELAAGGDPSQVEPEIVYEDKVAMTEGTLGSLAAGEWAYGDNDTLGFDTVYVCLSDGADPDTKGIGYITYKLATEDQYSVYKNYRGDWGWIGTVQTPWFLDDNIEADISITPKTQENPFSASGDYPGAVGIFEQRLFYARTDNDPQKVWTSYSGHLNNFGKSRPLTSADPIEATLKSGGRVDEIRHLLPLEKLLMFTAGSEWVFDHGTNSDALTPYSIRFRQNGYEGSVKDIKPIRIRNGALFVARDSKSVFSINPSDTNSLYSGEEITLLIPHLLENRTIVSWSYQQHPYNVVWFVMSDGNAVSLTYLPDQEIFAFCRHSTDGKFIDVGSVTNDGEDDVYFITERIINGTSTRFVEQLHTRVFDDVRDAYFVDCGLTYDNPLTITDVTVTATETTVTSASHGLSNGDMVMIDDVVGITGTGNNANYPTLNDQWYLVANKDTNTFELTDLSGTALTSTDFSGAYVSGGTAREGIQTVSGLDHLEGETVAVLADGNVFSKTVASGSITLGTGTLEKYAVVHAGLGYNCDIQTMRLEDQMRDGTMQGVRKRVKSATLRLKDTVGGYLGTSESDLTEIKWRQNEAWLEPNALKTGDVDHIIKGTWDTEGRIYYRQSDPLPATVLAIITHYETGDGK